MAKLVKKRAISAKKMARNFSRSRDIRPDRGTLQSHLGKRKMGVKHR